MFSFKIQARLQSLIITEQLFFPSLQASDPHQRDTTAPDAEVVDSSAACQAEMVSFLTVHLGLDASEFTQKSLNQLQE